MQKSSGVDSDELELNLELSNRFIKAQANANDLCTIILTQYGDLRSFIANDVNQDGSIKSFGNQG